MSLADFLLGLPICLASTFLTICAARIPLHLLQLESYQRPGYRRAVRDNYRRSMGYGLVAAAIAAVLFGLASFTYVLYATPRALTIHNLVASLWMILPMVLCIVAGVLMEIVTRKQPVKKPFVLTDRMKRLIITLAVVTLIISFIVAYLLRWLGVIPLLPLFTVALVALASICVEPLEKHINNGFFKDAQRILNERSDLVKIGITGSYGKTSTKFMLSSILSEKFNVLATPSSFNTPMGVTKIVREQLKPEHQVFIAEMGARHVGDIKELCELVHPSIGIITSIGPQHLETFKSQENITNTKYELIKSLPEDGHAIFIADSGIVEDLFNKTVKPAKHLAGTKRSGAGLSASNITSGPWGSRFTIEFPDGTTKDCQTRLLGSHNIMNLLLAASAANILGLTASQISDGIGKAAPVEHRLQLLPGSNGVTVIDDAFNSNPAGAAAALDVLRTFPKRRVLVTPGMVELGDEEEAQNLKFGQSMKDAVDIVILVGVKRTQPIHDGLTSAGFDESSIYPVEDLGAAQATLAKILQTGDTVLFENDLPDNYKE